ncbi:hypothetical protein BGZ59_004264, partial [Podila verticillata]
MQQAGGEKTEVDNQLGPVETSSTTLGDKTESICIFVNAFTVMHAVEDMAVAEKNKEQFQDMATENRAVETLLTGPQFDFLVIAAQVLLWGMHRGTVDSHLGVWMLSRIFTMRAQNEEAVMAARFGKEWG